MTTMTNKKYRIIVGLALILLITQSKQRIVDLDSLYEDTFATGDLFSPLYNETMLWGTYNPNVFFGIKDRVEQPLTVGLVWAVPNPTNPNGGMDIRHTYRYQSGDGVTAHFEYHDGHSCRQIIEDPLANARFVIDFIKELNVHFKGSTNYGYTEELARNQWKTIVNVTTLDPT